MSDERARRSLQRALVFFVVTHAVALGTMALVLSAGMDPSRGPVIARMAVIAQHPTAWRLGWLPWQLSALSDVWVCVALRLWARARADGVAGRIAIAAIALDLVGAIPEQWAEAMIVTSFVDASRGDPDGWRAAWSLYAAVTGVWANFAYTAMTACWMVIAARLLGRRVVPAAIEIAIVVGFVVSGTLTWLATTRATDAEVARWFTLSTMANGVAFPALILWTSVLAWRVRSAAR